VVKKLEQGLIGDDYQQAPRDTLSGKFTYPPFSVLNTREGWWQRRKRTWINLGIQSELGRGYTEEGTAYGTSLGKAGELNAKYKDASPGGSPRPAMNQRGHVKGQPIARGDGRGRPLTPPVSKSGLAFRVHDADLYRHHESGVTADDEETIGGTSIFDPVLCELLYRWFCPPGGTIVDPFAGGSVRGVVAGELGLHYHGVDLSGRQLEANRKQAKAIGTKPAPQWYQGDSQDLDSVLPKGLKADMIMSCPPYGNLEVYSDDPRDLSNMSVDDFRDCYFAVIHQVADALKDTGFACFVVGDYRDKRGNYCNLPSVTIAGFEEHGFHLYNYAILLNAIGSLPLRITRQFEAGRKLGKAHQDVIIMCKGNPNDFTKSWGPIP
jgi:hypothetical protein